MKKYLGLILVGTLVLTGCTKIPKLENGQEVVAEINGKQFTAEDLYAALRESYGSTALIDMVDTYIVENTMTEEAKKDSDAKAEAQFEQMKATYSPMGYWESFMARYGFNKNEEDKFLEFVKDNFRKSVVLEEYVKSTFTDKEIEDYYKKDIYGEQSVRHILIKADVKDGATDDEKKKAKEAALAKAKLLINQLSASKDLENDFSELAKKESADTASAVNGGLINGFTNEDDLVEEFFNASLKLEVGKMTTEPVETDFGYHIIYKVSQKEKPSIEDVKDHIIEKLTEKALAADNASNVYWKALREKNNLNIFDDTIKSNYNAYMSQF